VVREPEQPDDEDTGEWPVVVDKPPPDFRPWLWSVLFLVFCAADFLFVRLYLEAF